MISKNEKLIVKKIFEACMLDRPVLESLAPFSASGLVTDVIRKTDAKVFDKGVSDFLKTNTGSDLSQETFLRVIRSTQILCKDLDDCSIEEKLSKFTELFKACKVKAHSTLKTLHGADASCLLQPLKIGAITIYAMPRHADQIESLFESCGHNFKGGTTKVVVEHRSMVRDQIKALEIANKAFNTLDLLIAFLLGEKNKTSAAGVMRLSFVPFQQAIVTSASGFFGGEEKSFGFKENVNIFDLLSSEPCQGVGLPLELISTVLNPVDEIGRKISRAVEWIGEAYIEENKASAFVKVSVAMEVLLKVDEKGVISSSIMATMAEQCAFLLGKDVAACIGIEGKVKRLYGVRSSIVHSGTGSVEDSVLQEFLDFIRLIIFKVFDLKVTLNLKRIEELQETLKMRKYSGVSE